MLVLTTTSVVGGPVLACHTHHLWIHGFIAPLTADFTPGSHDVPVVLPSGCSAVHVTMLQLNWRTPWGSLEQKKKDTEFSLDASRQVNDLAFQLKRFNKKHLPAKLKKLRKILFTSWKKRNPTISMVQPDTVDFLLPSLWFPIIRKCLSGEIRR